MTDHPNPSGKPPLPTVRAVSPPEAIPVFNCVVMVMRLESGRVQARVANIAASPDVDDLQAEGSSEREVLGQVVNAFKRHVQLWTDGGQPVPWCEIATMPGEQQRLVAVHL